MLFIGRLLGKQIKCCRINTQTTWETFEPRLEKEEKKQGRKLQSISYSKSWPLCSEMLTVRNKKSKRSFPSGLNPGGKRPRIAGSGCACTCRVYPPDTHIPQCVQTHTPMCTHSSGTEKPCRSSC